MKINGKTQIRSGTIDFETLNPSMIGPLFGVQGEVYSDVVLVTNQKPTQVDDLGLAFATEAEAASVTGLLNTGDKVVAITPTGGNGGNLEFHTYTVGELQSSGEHGPRYTLVHELTNALMPGTVFLDVAMSSASGVWMAKANVLATLDGSGNQVLSTPGSRAALFSGARQMAENKARLNQSMPVTVFEAAIGTEVNTGAPSSFKTYTLLMPYRYQGWKPNAAKPTVEVYVNGLRLKGSDYAYDPAAFDGGEATSRQIEIRSTVTLGPDDEAFAVLTGHANPYVDDAL